MKSILVPFLIALCSPLAAFAGVMNGGGGKGVLCETVGQKPTLRVLDTYEAALRWPELPPRQDLVSEFQLGLHGLDLVWAEPATPVIAEPSREAAEQQLRQEFFDKLIYIPAGARIPVTTDATIPVLAPNCRQVQIAVYTNLGIEVDREYWQMLSPRDQAALAMHELLYFYRRTYGAQNSDETRAFVGRLFSTNPPTPRFKDAPSNGYINCVAGKAGAPVYDFAIYPAKNGNTIISFRQLDNATTLGRTNVSIPADWLMKSIQDPSSLFGFNYEMKSEFHYEDRSFNMARHTQNGAIEISLRNAKNENYGTTTVYCKLHETGSVTR